MNNVLKKGTVVLLAVVFAMSMVLPAALSFAETAPPQTQQTMTGLMSETTPSHAEQQAQLLSSDVTAEELAAESAAGAEASDGSQAELRAAGECTAFIQYLEYPWEEDPNAPTDEAGRVVLGTHEVTGLHEGDVLHAWDYVVDIPGHFFFDGWPLELTISSDPTQNVMTLIYVKLWNCEYTVNYYVMEGADLTADNWTDALKPEGVTFTKVASETYDNQIFDTLVKGDAYEYQVDGMYVIDTYPAEIRVGVEPDDNVINMLYTTSFSAGPDNVEVPSDYAVPDGPETPEETPDNSDAPNETPAPGDAALPDDTPFNKDEIIEVLPDGATPGDEVYDDFVGTMVRPGELVVTDEMLQHPVNQQQAELTAQAYATGLQQHSGLAQTGDEAPWLTSTAVMMVIIVALAIGIALLGRRAKQNTR